MVRAAQATGGGGAVSALALRGIKTATASTALAAIGQTRDRITGSQYAGLLRRHVSFRSVAAAPREVRTTAFIGLSLCERRMSRCRRLMRLNRQQVVEPFLHRLAQVVVRPAKGGVAARQKFVLLALQGPPAAPPVPRRPT